MHGLSHVNAVEFPDIFASVPTIARNKKKTSGVLYLMSFDGHLL